jgi:hypothetical protein
LNEFGLSDKVSLHPSTWTRLITYLITQILSLTCDNASNNDAMIAELEDLLPEFSKANHTRCFLHVNNLVARTLVRQFDVPRPTPGNVDDDDSDDELRQFAGDINLEDLQTREALLEDVVTGEIGMDDNIDGWVDEMAALSQAERKVLQNSLRPVRMLLVKVNIMIGTLLKNLACTPDSKTFIQNHQFDNPFTSSMGSLS